MDKLCWRMTSPSCAYSFEPGSVSVHTRHSRCNTDTPYEFGPRRIGLEILGGNYQPGSAGHFDVYHRPAITVLTNAAANLAEFRRLVERAGQPIPPAPGPSSSAPALGGRPPDPATKLEKLLCSRPRRRTPRARPPTREVDLATTADDETLLRINEALDKLAGEAPGKVELIKLRYFAGLSIEDAAGALGISPATAKRHWAFARAWLFAELQRTA